MGQHTSARRSQVTLDNICVALTEELIRATKTLKYPSPSVSRRIQHRSITNRRRSESGEALVPRTPRPSPLGYNGNRGDGTVKPTTAYIRYVLFFVARLAETFILRRTQQQQRQQTWGLPVIPWNK